MKSNANNRNGKVAPASAGATFIGKYRPIYYLQINCVSFTYRQAPIPLALAYDDLSQEQLKEEFTCAHFHIKVI